MRRVRWLCVAVLLILAGAVRLYGISFSPTAPRARPDEEIFLTWSLETFGGDHAAEIFKTGWPEGYIRLEKAVARLEASALSTWFKGEVNLGCLYLLNPLTLELPMRVVSVLFDLGTLCVVGSIARRLVFEKEEERTAAWFFAAAAAGSNYLLIRDAHFAVTDSPLTFWCAVCLYGAVRAVQGDEREGPRWLLLTAAAAAAGFAVKFSAAALIAPCLGAGLLMLWARPGARWRTLSFGLLALGVGILALIVVSPGILGHPKGFLIGMASQGGRYNPLSARSTIDALYRAPRGWIFHLFVNLPIAFGWPGLLLGFGGLGLAVRRELKTGLLLWATVITAYCFVGPIRMLFVRYAAPMVPALTVGIGLALTEALSWMRERALARYAPALTALGLLALACAPPIARAVQFDRLLTEPDTRDLASRWLIQHRDEGSAVTEGVYSEVQALDPAAAEACAAVVPSRLNPGIPLLPAGRTSIPRLIELGREGWGRIAREGSEHYVWGKPGRAHARFLLRGRGGLPCGRFAIEQNQAQPDPACFQLRDVIEPGTLDCGSTMDLFDGFWVPYAGFRGQRLPGPRIEIYDNLCQTPP